MILRKGRLNVIPGTRSVFFFILFLFLFGFFLGPSSCREQPSPAQQSSPDESQKASEKKPVEEVVKKYVEAVKNENVEVMWEMLSDNLKKTFEARGLGKDQFMSQAKQEITTANTFQGTITGLKIDKIDFKNEEAKVDFTLKRTMLEVTKRYTLEKVDKEWKIKNLKE